MINWENHIESSPGKLFGKPCVKNTRISVDLILEKLANGDSFSDLLQAYPNLSQDDIFACLMFASESIKNEVVYPKAS